MFTPALSELFLFVVLLLTVVTPVVASRRGRNPALWLALAVIFPIISLIVLLLVPRVEAAGAKGSLRALR